MKLIPCVALLATTILCACSSLPDAAPGLNKTEVKALTFHYWKPEYGEPNFNELSLAALMDRSTDPTLDGAKAEGHSSVLIIALASSGDDFFSKVLTTRSKKVQQAVKRDISSAWEYSKLEYPKTRNLLSTQKLQSENSPKN